MFGVRLVIFKTGQAWFVRHHSQPIRSANGLKRAAEGLWAIYLQSAAPTSSSSIMKLYANVITHACALLTMSGLCAAEVSKIVEESPMSTAGEVHEKHIPILINAAQHPEMMRDANLSQKEEGTGPKKPKIYFEVVRVNERIVVDQQNKTKAFSANMHNALYTLDSGRLRRLFWSDMRVVPKPGSPLMKALEAKRFLEEPPKKEPSKFPKWLEDLAKTLHLDQFLPRLLASIFLGFSATMLLYLLAYGMLWVFHSVTGYSTVGDADEPKGNGSEEELIKREQKRMDETKPMMLNV